MQRIYLGLFLLMISFPGISQPIKKNLKITWGEEMKASGRSTLSDVIGHDQSGIYALKSERNTILPNDLLEHYGNNLNLDVSQHIETNYVEGRAKTQLLLHLNNELYLFSSLDLKEEKKNVLYVRTVDKKTLKPITKFKKMGEVNYEGFKWDNGSFSCRLSRDSSKFLVYYNLPYDKGENEKFGFSVYDNDLEPLWQKDVTLPYKDELFDVERFVIDNAGNVHVLGQIYNEKRKVKRKGEVNYKYQILSYRENGNSLTEYPVEPKDIFLTDMQIAITKNQNIICSGFYTNKDNKYQNSIGGSYFLTIDGKTKAVIKQSSKEFTADFLTQNMKKSKAKQTEKKIDKGKNVEMKHFDLTDIILREDGGACLIAEQYYVHTPMSVGGEISNTRPSTYYFYYDIIVVNINPSGEIDWARKIPKKQVSTNDGGFFSSYAVAVVQDKLFFVFNDSPKNLFNKPGKIEPVKRKTAILAMVAIDGAGNMKKEALFMRKDVRVIARPKVCEQISSNELIIFGQQGKRQKLGKITFLENETQLTKN